VSLLPQCVIRQAAREGAREATREMKEMLELRATLPRLEEITLTESVFRPLGIRVHEKQEVEQWYGYDEMERAMTGKESKHG
jgi:hypothetical protein